MIVMEFNNNMQLKADILGFEILQSKPSNCLALHVAN